MQKDKIGLMEAFVCVRSVATIGKGWANKPRRREVALHLFGLRGIRRLVKLCGMHRGWTGGSPGNKRIRQILSAVDCRYWGRILVRLMLCEL